MAQAREVFGRLRELLPEERRTILELKAEGLSSKDIGERLGISERTVQRVLEDLRRRIGAGVGDLRDERRPPRGGPGRRRRRPPRSASPGDYEDAWRDADAAGPPPDPDDFLADWAEPADLPGARLALLRADLSLRWEAGERVGADWYRDRYPDLEPTTRSSP